MTTAAELWRGAVAVLDGNWAGSATMPSAAQYPHQWSWDSAFVSLGLARCDPARARRELESLFAGQWRSGRLPHIVFGPGRPAGGYFPGADFWDSGSHAGAPDVATSGLVQPPVHARAVLAVHLADPRSAAARPFLESAYRSLRRWHDYLRTARDVGGAGLPAIVHPWESGLDNSPMWDEPLAAVRLPAARPVTRLDTRHVDRRQRPTDIDYAVYLALAERYRDTGYDDGALDRHQFLVEDPLFAALLLDAERCLARIALVLGADPTPHEAAAHRVHDALLDRLWNDRLGAFTARDVRTDRLVGEVTVAGLVPLLDPWLPAGVADRVAGLAASADFAGAAHPVPSVPLCSPRFDRRRYWRGPTWLNTNWLLWTALRENGRAGLADRIADRSLHLLARHGFREYYDPLDGTGLGAHRFSWSAALALDWLAERRSAPGRRPAEESA